jgi:riboflavin synthase
VTSNGISLTVAEKKKKKKNGGFRCAIIPALLLKKTNLSRWAVGSLVNVEVDMIGKYVENFLKDAHLA